MNILIKLTGLHDDVYVNPKFVSGVSVSRHFESMPLTCVFLANSPDPMVVKEPIDVVIELIENGLKGGDDNGSR